MIKLYLDEDVHKKIALSLRLKGYDVISAHEVKNQGLPDYKQLQYAISEQRVSLRLMLVSMVSRVLQMCIYQRHRLGVCSCFFEFSFKKYSLQNQL